MRSAAAILATFAVVFSVGLSSASGDIWGLGNHWGLGSTSLVLNDANDRQSFRFTAQNSITVDTAHLHSNGGDANTIVELRADDGSGNPGAVLATGSIPTIGGGNFQAPLSPSVTLTQGSIYHYVIAKDAGGTIILPRVGSPGLSNHDSFTGIFDPDMTLLSSTDGGANYTDSGTTLSWRVGLSNSSTGDAVGHPYDTLANINQSRVGLNTWKGQSFVAPGNLQLTQINLAVFQQAAAPTDSLRVHLERVLDGMDLFNGVLPTSAGQGVLDYVSIGVPNVPLTGGGTYIVWVESVGSAAITDWQLLGSRATASQGNLQNANFQGDLGQLVSGISATSALPASHGSVDFSDLRHDAYFTLDLIIPEPSVLPLLAIGFVVLRGARKRFL